MKGILNGTRAIIRLTDNVGTTNQATLMGPHSHHKGRHKKKTVFFSEKLRKGGRGVSPNPKFPYQKILRFFWIFFSKGGGSHLFQKGVIIKNGDIGIFSPKRGLSPNP